MKIYSVLYFQVLQKGESEMNNTRIRVDDQNQRWFTNDWWNAELNGWLEMHRKAYFSTFKFHFNQRTLIQACFQKFHRAKIAKLHQSKFQKNWTINAVVKGTQRKAESVSISPLNFKAQIFNFHEDKSMKNREYITNSLI